MDNQQSTKRTKLRVPINSNWEFIAFYLIEPFITERNRQFKRTQVINERTLGNALLFLDVLGHKKEPEHPDKTLQKTLQNMRDKGWLNFMTYQGDYELTDAGYDLLRKLKKDINIVKEGIADVKKPTGKASRAENV